MKQKKTVLVLLLAFVLLLGGAYLLYTRLEGSVNTYQLSAQETRALDGTAASAMRFACPTTSASR